MKIIKNKNLGKALLKDVPKNWLCYSTILISGVLLSGCSLFKDDQTKTGLAPIESLDAMGNVGTKGYVEPLVTKIEPKWFAANERFQLQGSDGQPLAHMFFDVDPAIDTKSKTVNFLVSTPEDYPTEQSLDLASGQLYLSRKYCSQSDLWKTYKGVLNTPPYTIGFIPRVLDQLNMPQKIIVFGQKDYYRKYFKTNFFDARVVGAFIEQVCPKRSCSEKGSWLSRLVLVGVQKNHADYKKVSNLEDLKKKVDWEEVKAFVGNGSGQNQVLGEFYPAYRMGANVSAGQAFYHLKKYSHVFNVESLGKMRRGCQKLYDHFWTSFTKEGGRRFDKTFKELLLKYHNRYSTCSEYVYPSSINDNPQRHWFFAYLSGYYKLVKMGYYFDCGRGIWVSNPYIEKGSRLVSPKNQFRYCKEKDVGKAMEQMPAFLNSLRDGSRNGIRYVDYDNLDFAPRLGTHGKLYSWVENDNKSLSCSKDKDGNLFKSKLPTFPKDIDWEFVDIALGKKSGGKSGK